MQTVTETMRRLFAGLRGRGKPGQPAVPELQDVLDGDHAVAVVEACVAEATGLGTAALASSSCFAELERVNLLGGAFEAIAAGGARDALATTMGSAAAGLRATTFLRGSELLGAQDQLAQATARHLPLIVHVSCGTQPGPGLATAGGHGAYHAVAETGCIQLFAGSVQEAIDLSLIARQVAELSLVPALVVIDAEHGRTIGDIRLPSPDLVRRFLGDPDDAIAAATPAQGLMFGRNRRRVPRWHDLDRPSLQGAFYDPHTWALGAAGQRPYFGDHVPALLQQAFVRFGELTSRHLAPLCEVAVDGAEVLIVAQGAAVELAAGAVEQLRKRHRLRVGLVGVRCLRPFPGERLAGLLRGRQAVLVLERDDTPLGGDPPLMREVRAVVQRALEQGQTEPSQQPRGARWHAAHQPRLHVGIFGLGGEPLRTGDLIACCRELGRLPPRVYLGVDFWGADSAFPKRQAALDELRRAYPELDQLAVRANGHEVGRDVSSPDAEGTVRFAVYRRAGRGAVGVLQAASRSLQRAVGGQLRGQLGAELEAWEACIVDRLAHAPGPTPSLVGDDQPVDIALVTRFGIDADDLRANALSRGAVLLFERASETETPWLSLPTATLRALHDAEVSIFACTVAVEQDEVLRQEQLVGALLGAANASGKRELSSRRLQTAREHDLETLSAAAREQRLSALVAGFEQARPVELDTAVAVGVERSAGDVEVPVAARRTVAGGAAASPIDDLARFWNTVGVLEAGPSPAEPLNADPLLCSGVVPPLSASFRQLTAGEMLPDLDPTHCTGCGLCWTLCPEGAIGPVALTPKTLLEGGIQQANEAGTDADPLRMLVAKLAPRVGHALDAADMPPTEAAALLAPPFTELMQRMELPDGWAGGVSAAFKAVLDCIGRMQVVRTESFWHTPRRQNPADGELLSLAINPDTCKSCGLCVAVCEPQALRPAPFAPADHDLARQRWRLWERLPDTTGETIRRVSQQQEVGLSSAILLSRHCLLAAVGGDGMEAGSGARIALRAILAVGEYELQRRLQTQVQQLENMRGALASSIREALASALPTSDIDALASGIETLDRSHTSLADLTSRVEQVVESPDVDVDRLRRLVAVARELADLHWNLSQGVHAMGRARLSLVLAPHALTRGLGTFPHNPFQVPAINDASEQTVALARGLLEGQLRQTIAGFRAARRAEVNLSNPAAAALVEPELERIDYAALTAEERALCPPLVLVSASLDGPALTQLFRSALPVKVLLLSDGGDPLLQPTAAARTTPLQLLSLGDAGTFVMQSSIAHPEHLFGGLSAALAHPGPAVIHVHAPSPAGHGFARDGAWAQAQLAVASRSFPLFVLDPAGQGVFGSRLRLDGNPQADRPGFVSDDGVTSTPLDWLVSESRFSSHFTPLNGAPTPTLLTEYLELAPAKRRRCTPVVLPRGTDGDLQRGLRPSAAAVVVAEQRLWDWRVLQELSGVVTPFAERVRAEAEQETRATHEQAAVVLAQQHAQQIAQLQADQAAKAAHRIRDQLMRLAGYAVPPEGGG